MSRPELFWVLKVSTFRVIGLLKQKSLFFMIRSLEHQFILLSFHVITNHSEILLLYRLVANPRKIDHFSYDNETDSTCLHSDESCIVLQPHGSEGRIFNKTR